MKKLKGMLKFLLLVAIAILAISVVKDVRNRAKIETGEGVPTEELYLEEIKAQPSEISGMTKYDKYTMGLDPENPDTDGDGLSDEEEINEYHSDPLKQSTAGDLYSDKYKIENGMDVNVKYPFEGEIIFKYNQCSEIKFVANKIEDTYAVAEELSLANVPDDLEVLKAYRIYNYSNKLSIDLTDVLEINNVQLSNIGIYEYTLGGGAEQLKYKYENNCITLKKDLDYNEMYNLYIVKTGGNAKPKEIVDSIADMNMKRGTVSEVNTVTPMAYAIGSPILTGFSINFFHTDTPEFKLYYVDTGVDYVNEEMINKMLDGIACVSGVRRKDINENVQRICLTEEQYEKKLNKFFAIDVLDTLYICNGDGVINASILSSIYGFFTYENVSKYVYQFGGSPNPESLPDIVEYTGDFNQDFEVLPFKNFATGISKDGSCMGVALLTARVHNKKSADENGSYYIDDSYGTISWDLTKGEENRTLLDLGLYDYKNSQFVKERKNSAGYVEAKNDAEQQFLNMIACLWKEGNDISKRSCVYRLAGKINYYIGMFDGVKKRLNNGDVLICGMGTEKGAHAVNIYKYTTEEDGTIIFSVYDSNYPGVEGTLRIIPKTSPYGFKDSFEFEYVTDAYTISSMNVEKYFIIIMDDDMRIVAR